MSTDAQPEAKKKARRRKRRRKPPDEFVHYIVKIEEWDWGLSFGVSMSKHFTDPYMDFRHLHINGSVLQPKAIKIAKAKMTFFPDRDLEEEHRQQHEPTAVGSLDAYGGVLTAYLSMPRDTLNAVLQMLIAGRFKYVVMTGGRLRYRKARVQSYGLECALDEDDYPPDED